MSDDLTAAGAALLACPFCGGDRFSVSAAPRLAGVMCMSCGVTGPWLDSRKAAVTAWNRRASTAARAVDEALSVERVAEALLTLGDRYPIFRQSPTRHTLGGETWWEHHELAAALVAHLRGPRPEGEG